MCWVNEEKYFYTCNATAFWIWQKKFSLSFANALKLCTIGGGSGVSFENIHTINKRATPDNMCLYKHSIQLYKLFNSSNHSTEIQSRHKHNDK